MNRVEPNRNVYVGHRYVPLLVGEWDKSIQYEGLSIVTFKGASYTSKKMTPAGIDIENEEYWVVTGNYNAQIEYYRQDVERVKDEIRDTKSSLETEISSLKTHVNTSVSNMNNELSNAISDMETFVETETQNLTNRIETVEGLTDPTIEEITLNVPSDFSDLQSAVDYSLRLKKGIKVEIMMESGFSPSSGIYIIDQDASFITLSSVDDVVSVSNNYSGHFIHVYKADAPVLNCLVDLRDLGGDGVRANYTSTASIHSQCGVINAGGGGVYCRTSTVTGAYSIFTGANDRACWITRASNASFAQADFSGVKQGNVGIYVSRSSIADLSDVKVNDCNVNSWAVYVVRSKANLINAEINNSSAGALLATSNSQVVASEISANNSGDNTIIVNRSSTVQLGVNSDLGNSGGVALTVRNDSNANANGLRASYSTDNPLIVEDGSHVNITEFNARSCQGDGIIVSGGSTANLPDVVVSEATGNGIKITNGSTVNYERGFVQNTAGFGVDIQHASHGNGRNSLVDRTARITDEAETGTGTRVSYGSTLNLVTARVRESELNDVSLRYGSTISGHQLTTTNGNPELSDTNMNSFNAVSGRGVFYT